MTERSWFWDGAAGDGDSYDDDTLMDRYFRMLFNGTGNRGVLRGWLSELEVTPGGVNTATVLTGGSVVYGLFHEADANVDVNIPNGPRTDLIVVRRSWAAQTARITRIAGPGAALTQTPNVTYDIPLASVDVDAGGNLTITDTREYCTFPLEPGDGSVVAESIAADAVTTAVLENQARWRTHGAGMLKPDATGSHAPEWRMEDYDPAAIVSGYIIPYWSPMNCAWRITGGYQGVWLTERVPEDFTGDLYVYIWNTPDVTGWLAPVPRAITGDAVWDWFAWAGASGAAFAAQAGSTTVSNAGRTIVDASLPGSPYMFRDLIATLTVAAGDVVHLNVIHDGLDAADTVNLPIKLMAVELAYTADS
jgi:hypothetical protein